MPGLLRDVDLNLLHTFRVFAAVGGVDQAARALGRSQPAISTRLRQLERQIGVALFERLGRRIHLTAAGRRLDGDLAQVFEGLAHVVGGIRAAPAASLARYRIGALTTVGVYLLAPALSSVRRRRGGARFEIHYGSVSGQLGRLAAGALEAVAGIGRPPANGMVVKRLGDAAAMLIARAGDPILRRRTVSASMLVDRDLLAYGRTGDHFFDVVTDWIDRHDLAARIVVEVAHIQTLKTLVLAGAGLAIVPGYTVVEHGLGMRLLPELSERQPIWLATRPSLAEDPILSALAAQAARLVSGARRRTARDATSDPGKPVARRRPDRGPTAGGHPVRR